MKLRLVLSSSFLLLLGIFLSAQTIESFPKRLAIEGGISYYLLHFENQIKDAMPKAGYPAKMSADLDRWWGYVGISFRLTDHYTVGYRNTRFKSSVFTGHQNVDPLCFQPCIFGICGEVVCEDQLDFSIAIGDIKANELFVRWHLRDQSLGFSIGVFFYQPTSLSYNYSTDVFENYYVSRRDRGDFDIKNGLGASLGGYYHFAKIYKRLRLKAGFNYYWFPNGDFGPVTTEFGTFPSSKINLDRLNLELGLSYLVF